MRKVIKIQVYDNKPVLVVVRIKDGKHVIEYGFFELSEKIKRWKGSSFYEFGIESNESNDLETYPKIL